MCWVLLCAIWRRGKSRQGALAIGLHTRARALAKQNMCAPSVVMCGGNGLCVLAARTGILSHGVWRGLVGCAGCLLARQSCEYWLTVACFLSAGIRQKKEVCQVSCA